MNDSFTTLKTTAAALTTLLVAPAAVVASRFGDSYVDTMLRLWARGLLAAAEVSSEVQGLELIPDGPCIFVCNHASHFDVLVVLAHVRRHLRFVAKQELFRIPIFGQSLRALGNIEVDRSGGGKDRQRLREAVEAVQRRVNVMFFPEGSRSDDGVLQPFKKGAAILALDAQVPVVPMAIAGTRNILPRGGRRVQGGQHAILRIGAPVATVGLTVEDRDSLTQTLRERVRTLLTEAEQKLGESP